MDGEYSELSLPRAHRYNKHAVFAAVLMAGCGLIAIVGVTTGKATGPVATVELLTLSFPVTPAPLFFRTGCATWDVARSVCMDAGGDLVMIKDEAKDAEVRAFIQGFSDYDSCQGPYPWIGGTCTPGSPASSCRWVDGTSENYQHAGFRVDDPKQHFYTNGNWGTWCSGCSAMGICERTVHTEYFRTDCLTWANAREACIQGGGDLVMIKDSTKDGAVRSYMQQFHDYGECPGQYPWIGGICVPGESTSNCRWVDGSSEGYQHTGFTVDDPMQHLYTDGRWGTWCPTCVSRGICERHTTA